MQYSQRTPGTGRLILGLPTFARLAEVVTGPQLEHIATTINNGTTIPPALAQNTQFLIGITLVADRQTRLHENVNRRAELIAQRGMPPEVLGSNFERIMKSIADIRSALSVSLLSSKPVDYAAFLARTELDFEAFIRHAPFFAGDRAVTAVSLDDETESAREGFKRLLTAVNDQPNMENITAFVNFAGGFLSRQERWRDSSIAEHDAARLLVEMQAVLNPEIGGRTYGMLSSTGAFTDPGTGSGNAFMLALVDPSFEWMRDVLPHFGMYMLRNINGKVRAATLDICGITEVGNLRVLFSADQKTLDKHGIAGSTSNNGKDLVVSTRDNGSQNIIIHEEQHAFDKIVGIKTEKAEDEYRAELAALALARDFRKALLMFYKLAGGGRDLTDPGEILSKALATLEIRMLRHSPEDDPHAYADQRIIDQLAGLNGTGMKTKVREHLNSTYRERCGLSYDEILEPFRAVRE